jgi:hypothetical protein
MFKMEFESINQNKEKKKLVVALVIMSMIAMIMLGYIISEQQDCEVEKNESSATGFNDGMEYWNTVVVYNVNNNRVVPYWFNQSYYELNIDQICEDGR